jgi:hypothetical protein
MATVTTPNGNVTNTNIPAEFQQLPLHAIIAEPLMATVDAQAKSAIATQNFIQSFLEPVPGNNNGDVQPMTVDFNTSITDAQNPGQTNSVSVSAPLLSIVPIPNLLIDSLSINFKYEVSQVITSSSDSTKGMNGNLNAKIGMAAWGANLSLAGSITNESKQSNTVNRNGALDISVHASQAPIPEGLSKIMSILSNAVTISATGAAPAAATQPVTPSSGSSSSSASTPKA